MQPRLTWLWRALAALCLVAAFAPPIEPASHGWFAAHMAQHLLLGLVAPLFLVLGGLGDLLRRVGLLTAGRSGSAPLLAAAASVLVWTVWHLPAAYDLALRWAPLHAVEHLTLLATGVALWATTATRRTSATAAALALFLVTFGTGFLGAALALAPHPLYDLAGPETTAAALQDQQLGALVMWTPGSVLFLLAAVAQLLLWLGADRAPGPVRTRPG